MRCLIGREMLMLGLLLCGCAASATQCGLATAKPEEMGLSAARVENLDNAMRALVEHRVLSGMVIAVARDGRVIDCRGIGYQDIGAREPMKTNAIFRIASMTKPITGVAMMILYEEGKWLPRDPIAKYLPELSNVKVFAGVSNNGRVILLALGHAPTMEELMTQTAGFTYGFANSRVDSLYRKAHLFEAKTPQEFLAKLARLPLLYQPGNRWVYSVAVDLQGIIVERLSGMPLSQFMEDKIFRPLNMKDTGFFVPRDKLSRVATLYTQNSAGSLIPVTATPWGKVLPLREIMRPPPLPSAGGGLYSTAADYLRFAQMLLNGGQLDGVRILAPSSVHLMTVNHLGSRILTGAFGIGTYVMRPGSGYGYDVSVLYAPAMVNSIAGRDTYSWGGADGTWFWADPTNSLAFVGMTQKVLPSLKAVAGAQNMLAISQDMTYQALTSRRK